MTTNEQAGGESRDLDLSQFEGMTPGPWHWVNPETDEPIDLDKADPRIIPEAQATHIGIASLRTVKERKTFAGPLPVFLAETDELTKSDARAIAAVPSLIAEVKRLREENANKAANLAHADDKIAELQAFIEPREQRIAELERDRERMEWLNANYNFRASSDSHGVTLEVDGESFTENTLAQAIDAAMQTNPER